MRKPEENPEFLIGTGPEDPHRWAIDTVIALAVIAVLIGLAGLIFSGCTGCPKPEPTPTPTASPTPTATPTPEPTPQTFAHLRLTARGSDFVREADPTYQMRKCVACCKNTQGTGWPGLSIAEIDFLHAQGLCNLLQWRVGPFRAANEPEWVATGGGAYVEVDGKADLTRFNQPYWDALRAAVIHAGELGMNVEVSVLDGWSTKVKCWSSDDTKPCAWHPWLPGGNIQHEDHLTSAWSGTNPDAVQLAYILKVYETIKGLQNTILEGGTETDQLAQTGRDRTKIVQWDLTQEALLRQAEAAAGDPQRLYGTNFVGDESMAWLRKGRFSFQNVHQTTPIGEHAIVGFFDPADFVRPVVNDEANAEPALQAIEQQAFACYARANGAYWGLWRDSQDDQPWKASLSLVAQDSINGCSEKAKTGCAFDILPMVRVDCHRFSGNRYDCTGKNARNNAILPEGSASRAICEQVAAGLKANQGVEWISSNPSAVQIVPTANRWMFTIKGAPGAKATLSCHIPSTGTFDACRATPLEVQ